MIWKNLDVKVEITADNKAHVKEKHDIVFEDDDLHVILPFYLGEKQSIEIKHLELLDIIKNKTKPRDTTFLRDQGQIGRQKNEGRKNVGRSFCPPSFCQPAFSQVFLTYHFRLRQSPVHCEHRGLL